MTDGGAFAFDGAGGGFDAWPLGAGCDPDSGAGCPSGWTCYGEHTAAAWSLYNGGDVFSRCTLAHCAGATSLDCNALDGTCVCPARPDGTYPACTGSDLAEAALICVTVPR